MVWKRFEELQGVSGPPIIFSATNTRPVLRDRLAGVLPRVPPAIHHHCHCNLFPGFSIANRQHLENQTTLFENYSITLCFRLSIIRIRERANLPLDHTTGLFFKEGECGLTECPIQPSLALSSRQPHVRRAWDLYVTTNSHDSYRDAGEIRRQSD